MKNKSKTYQQRIQETRKDKDIGQKEIAEHLKITQQQYSLYETGKRTFPADLIPQICLYLQVSSDYILGLPKGMTWPK